MNFKIDLKWLGSRYLWGGLFIFGGLLYLLQNLDVVHLGDLFWVAVFGLVGVYFLSIYLGNRAQWWALIPGIILGLISLTTLLGVFFEDFGDTWGGVFFMAGIGLAFIAVYVVNRSLWWAVIPGGVLIALSVISALEELNTQVDTGGIFLIGLGLTFAILGMLPAGDEKRSMSWAFIPAIILVIIGGLIAASSMDLINYVWPVFLVIIGVLMLIRSLQKK